MRTPIATLNLDRLQREIAADLRISEAYLSQILSGTRVPKVPIAIRLAAALGSSVEELWG